MKNEQPYGSWESPITASSIAQAALPFYEIYLKNNNLYWLEGRANEGGRHALMSWNEKEGEKELLPKEFSVRSRVHEYGGGALLVNESAIYFVNDHDQQIYCLNQEGTVRQVTRLPHSRFTDGAVNPDGSSLFFVMEEHLAMGVENSIVKIDVKTGTIQKIIHGNDFYSAPRISQDGTSLAYVTWNHPYMPWDKTELWVYQLNNDEQSLIAGNGLESISDPQWNNNKLYYISDHSNWWNIYCSENLDVLAPMQADFSHPQWTFANPLYGFSSNGIVASAIKNGSNEFWKNSKDGWTPLNIPYSAVRKVVVDKDLVAFIGGSSDKPTSIVLYNLSNNTLKVIKSASKNTVIQSYISYPEAIEFPTTNGKTAYAFYYPPCNPHFKASSSDLPPLLVKSHGGPTAHVSPALSSETLFWTSRGIAVMYVNYGGSTGYGREYRDRLKNQWGIVDVDDCVNAALYCVKNGLADPARLAIEGGSAGGYTTLACLAFRSVFKVGADYFGVSDLELLAQDTHKFESHYLDQLIGPYPEAQELYHLRSPIHSVETIKCPVIIFQGDEDRVVPPAQSELMYKSLCARNIPTAYLLYKGEQHGFRKAENIQRSLEAELYFFSKVLNFSIHDKIKPIEIDNL